MNYWQAGVLPRGQGVEDSRGTMCSPALHLLQFQLLSYQQNPKLDTVVRTSPSFTSLSFFSVSKSTERIPYVTQKRQLLPFTTSGTKEGGHKIPSSTAHAGLLDR